MAWKLTNTITHVEEIFDTYEGACIERGTQITRSKKKKRPVPLRLIDFTIEEVL